MVLSILRDFLESSTIHGLVHISTAKSRIARAVWVAIVVACFAFAIHMIVSSYKEWQESPVSTTITTHPITDLEFPDVTVCPPWESNTAVNHLLGKVRGVNFTDEMRTKLRSIAKELFIEIPDQENRKQMMKLLSIENMRSIADGQLKLPEVRVQKEGRENLLHVHYMLELPDNIEELVGEGHLVLDVRSKGEWDYRLQNEKYRAYHGNEGVRMFDAEEFCLSWHTHMTSVESEEELDEIKNVAISAKCNEIWLGGTRKIDGSWQWLDGRAWTFQDWAFEEPNNETGFDCLTYRVRDAWYTHPCTLPKPLAFVCQSAPLMKVGNHTFSLRGTPAMPRTFHLWRNFSTGPNVADFVPKLWIEKNNTAEDVQALVNKELNGSISTPRLGQAAPSDYYEKMHKFTAVVELPKNFTKIMGDGALVVDLDVTFPVGQSGNKVQITTDGPRLEYFNLKRDWFYAEEFCVSKGGHLASVPSPYHWRRLQDFISEEGLEDSLFLWLGGSDERTEGEWVWSDGTKWSDEKYWRKNFPSDLTSRNCLKMGYGKFYDNECSDTLSFVCEIPSTMRISKETRLIFTSENLTVPGIQFSWESQPLKMGATEKKNVLVYEKTKRTWTEAEAHCVSKGGHLASVSSLDDWDRLKSYIKTKRLRSGQDRLWIGGTKVETGGNWTWSDGKSWFQVAGSRNNLVDESKPDKRCINIWKDTWKNSECSHKYSKYPSICTLAEEDNTGSGNNGADSGIGGFTVSWKLVRSDSAWKVPQENISESGTGLWRTVHKDLKGRNWIMVLIMSLVQKSQMANIGEEQVSKMVLRHRWNTDILNSPCLNEGQIFDVIFKAGHDLGLKLGDTPWIRDDDLEFATELYTALRDCPEHLIESAKMFFFFEHLIKHHSLETLIASTMNNIAPRAEKNIKDFSSVNLWYTRLNQIFDFELAPVLDAFFTTDHHSSVKDLNPPFLVDEKQEKKTMHRPSGDAMAQISHPPHLEPHSLYSSAFIPFCAFKSNMVLSDNPRRIADISYPLCSLFQPTLLDGQLCYKLQVNSSSAAGKKNQLMLLLDYNEDRSISAPNAKEVPSLLGWLATSLHPEINTLNLDGAVNTQKKEAKVHIDTLSSFNGFGSGTYKISDVKKMTTTEDFMNMPLEDRKCEVKPYEECQNQKLLEECNCDHLALIHNQEKASCDREGWDCVERNFDKNFSCPVTCEGIYADILLALLGEEEKREDMNKVSKLIGQYNKFKRRTLPNFRFNPQKGTTHYGEYLNASSLHLVQIYFDTATFDEIERDVKFEGQLSLIGGTMGLLSGFSIISGIELFLFLVKLVTSFRIKRE